jgi:hypothetical protein
MATAAEGTAGGGAVTTAGGRTVATAATEAIRVRKTRNFLDAINPG